MSRAIAVLLLALVGVLCPLVMFSFDYGSFTAGKALCLRAGVAVCLALFVLAHLVQKQPLDGAARNVRHAHFVLLPALLFLAFTAVSAILSPWTGVWLGNSREEGALTFLAYGLVFWMTLRDLEPRRWMLWVWFAALCPSFVIGALQLMGHNPLHLFPNGWTYYDSGRYYPGQYWGTVGNTDYLSALLCLASGAFSAAGFCAKSRRDRLILIALFITVFFQFEVNVQGGLVALAGGLWLMCIVLVDTAQRAESALLTVAVVLLAAAAGRWISFSERGCALGFSAAAAALTLLATMLLAVRARLLRAAPGRLPKRKAVLLPLLLLPAICLLLVWCLPSLPGETLTQLHALLHGRADDSFGSGRIYIWRQLLPLIRERFWFGGGPDTLEFRGLRGFSTYNETLGGYVSTGINSAHNEYLNILINQGIFALLSYLLQLGTAVVMWWKHSARTSVAVAGGAACFYAIQAFFGISAFYIAPLFWVFLALCCQIPDEGKLELPHAARKKTSGKHKSRA